jgi:hypothetical protein
MSPAWSRLPAYALRLPWYVTTEDPVRQSLLDLVGHIDSISTFVPAGS